MSTAYLLFIGEPETNDIGNGITMVTIGASPEAFVFTTPGACAEFIADRFPRFDKLSVTDCEALSRVMGGIINLHAQPPHNEIVERISDHMFIVRTVTLIERDTPRKKQ